MKGTPRSAPSLIASLVGAALTAVATVLAWITSQGSSWTAYDGRLPWAWTGGDPGSEGTGHGPILLALAVGAIIAIIASQLRPGRGLGRLSAAIGGVVAALALADLASFSKSLGPGFEVADILGPGPFVATAGGLMMLFSGMRLDRADIGHVGRRSDDTRMRHIDPPDDRFVPPSPTPFVPTPPTQPGAASSPAGQPAGPAWWE